MSGHVIGDDVENEIAELTRVCRHGGWILDCPGDSQTDMKPDPYAAYNGWEEIHYVGTFGKNVYNYRKLVDKTGGNLLTDTNDETEDFGAVYDRHETQTDDVEFILSVLGSPVKKVLEVCCGTGRILVPLAKAGHDVTGFDKEQTMMNRITEKAKGLKNIKWHKADAVHDDWGSGFDVVVLAGNILFNIESDMDYKKAQELFIKKAADALVPGGHVYIGYNPWAPNGRTLLRAGESCEDDGSIVWSWEDYDDNGNFTKNSLTAGSFDEETCMLRAKRFFERRLADGKVIKEETDGAKHYATLEHLRGWLSNAGFEIEFEYENFDKKPVDDDSRTIVIYARKKQ